jgi:hypothetical protein
VVNPTTKPVRNHSHCGALYLIYHYQVKKIGFKIKIKCVNVGFVERPLKLQILFCHQPMHARLKKSLKRRPEPVAFESKITEKGGMKVIEFLFFSSSSSSSSL